MPDFIPLATPNAGHAGRREPHVEVLDAEVGLVQIGVQEPAEHRSADAARAETRQRLGIRVHAERQSSA